MTSHTLKPKALLFDVFGTTVNWRLTVTETLRTRASETLSSPTSSLPSTTRLRASTTDWPAFAQAWRDTYTHFTRNYPASSTDPGESNVPFKTVDQHHHDSLIALLEEHELECLWSADEISEISRIWHFLIPWPDTSRGLRGLNDLGIQTCSLSNGNVSLLEDMAKFAHLPWTHIFSSEHFGAYKPSPKVYSGAVKKLGLREEECAMVAAHLADLKAAHDCGLKTIYVEREREESWPIDEIEAAKKEGWVDLWVALDEGEGKGGFLAVVRKLAA
ncbi:hypothetical protein MMC30_006001 [Trapelia coarctata]|nr:hypothetical protein [Trapelia coarctata]